ncbi:hypothetical protein ANCCAN_21804 [Ancylostoma caninum]|uniref:Uncharacterized protein n=1 Tax=Ancylostoma caninum TaxID=29170 RepID=A0A368FQB9_ANCCA|nr:hypothetical protein ANCCAN_21804 [Ancylostoma caninum]
MRFQAILLVLLGVLATASGLFRSSMRGIATVDADTGDIVWIPVPGDTARDPIAHKRVCVFCRGFERR